MASKRRHEGYLMIDHRDSPGLTDAEVNAGRMPMGAGRGLFESAISTCNHCGAGVMRRPERTRAREWCKKCDHYICDGCGGILAVTGVCKPFAQIVEEEQERAFTQAPETGIILLS